MASNKLKTCKLGKLIELLDETNSRGQFGVDDVRGVNNLKSLMPTKADLLGRDISKFQIVKPNDFVFNHRTSRNGSKFSIALNSGSYPIICTEDYVVFRIKSDCNSIILTKWLYIFFNRPEFDRYVITNSWGSSTEFYNWEDICDIDIALPDITVQQKYVDIYESMVANQRSYEKGLDDLKLTCDAYIEELRRKIPCEKIGPYIKKENKNSDGSIQKVLGIGQNGFMKPQKEPNESLKNYKILKKGDIGYAPPLYNVLTGALHCYQEDFDAVCSPIYEVFKTNADKLLPEYLTLWLKRDEFKRYAVFYAQGVRQTFDYDYMCDVRIPIPVIEIQKSIANIYKVYTQRKAINEKLKAQIRDICPILIKGSLEA